MKNKPLTILLIVILSILALSITWIMISLINNDSNFLNLRFSSEVSNELAYNETYNNIFDKIDVNISSGDIYIKNSSNNEIKVLIYGNKENIDIDTNNKELTIKITNKDCNFFCFNNIISKIEIYLPINYSNSIKIINDYGNVDIDEFPNANFDIETNCGNTVISSANIINTTNAYGNTKIGNTTKANIHSQAGNVIIDSVDDVVIENEYGDIKIETINNYLDIVNNCGDIEIDNINLNKDSKIIDEYGDIEINNTNEIYIDAKTDLGDIEIKNNYHKSSITLKINNDYGDITVEN